VFVTVVIWRVGMDHRLCKYPVVVVYIFSDKAWDPNAQRLMTLIKNVPQPSVCIDENLLRTSVRFYSS